MSLATRCTACGTIFRVVQDQLRVSEGWVRCGRCAEVFDAREQLFDIDREVPPPWPATPPPDITPADLTSEPVTAAPPMPQDEPSHAGPPETETTWVVPREFEPVPAEQSAAPQGIDIRIDTGAPPGRREPFWGADERPAETLVLPETSAPEPTPLAAPEDPVPDVLVDARLAALAAEVNSTPASAAPAKTPQASFLRQAAAAQRWQRPQVRVALALSTLLLLLVLALQLVLQLRSAMAALYPPSAPLLQSLCGLAGCELQPWRRIDALAVESSSLTQAGSGNHYQLTVLLNNKADYTLALPWVDLSLTDASGAMVTRRMLKPTDFNLSKTSMAGKSEQPLQLVFSTGKHKVSGYSVEIFHP
jgi:predicted Zn finger-like uncharacterized protein